MIEKKRQGLSMKFANTKKLVSTDISQTIKASGTPTQMKEKEVTQTLTIRLPLELYEALREHAFKERLKMNPIIVQLLEAYLKDKL